MNENTTKILCITRHSMSREQIDELTRVFGVIEVKQISTVVNTANDVMKLVRKYDANEVVVVLPLTIIAALTARGIYPIVSVRKKHDEHGNDIPPSNHIHDYFKVVERVEIVSHPLEG